MKNLNACIAIISSRTKCLRKCIGSLYDNYNCDHDYPVYVLYFDDIYDSKEYQDEIHSNVSPNIHFRSIPYKTPSHVKEKEMFYNRKNLQYVRKGEFTIRRKGYLHMCNFWINFYGYPNTEFEKYDYLMSHDDESGYVKKMEVDPFEIVSKEPIDMTAYISGQRLRNGRPHQGHYDTRVGLWEFTKHFITENNVDPKSPLLKKLLDDNDAETNFHFLPWSDTYVLDLNFARTDLWKKWVEAVNNNGGVYKYRWGDNEIISLFGLMYQEGGIRNLGFVRDGFHDQGMFRSTQSYAPSIKDTRR